jgi:hypothetical protein
MVKRTVKSTSIAKVPKATMAFHVPPGEQSSSAEEFRVYPVMVTKNTFPNTTRTSDKYLWIEGSTEMERCPWTTMPFHTPPGKYQSILGAAAGT